jgi:hypothetical protein
MGESNVCRFFSHDPASLRPGEVLEVLKGQRTATNAVTAVTSGGRVPSASSEKEFQHEDESIYGHRRRSGNPVRCCHVDRTIGLGR